MLGTTWGLDEDKHENHWRRTFCQIPFPSIYEHAENGKRSLHRLVEFFRRKAEAERQANEGLRAALRAPIDSSTSANLEDLEEPGSSIRRALLEVKHYVDASVHQQSLLATVLEEQVAEPLVALQEASAVYIRTLQGEIRNVNEDYIAALQGHAQAAGRRARAEEELRDALDRQRLALHHIGVPEFELQRLALRVARAEEELAQAELIKAQAKTHLYNRIVSRDEMAMAVSVAYQKAEEERLDQLQSCLQRFLHIERERLKAADKTLQVLETHITGIHRAEDIQLLIHNHRNPDNMHFQGKALALLDWHWRKLEEDRERRRRAMAMPAAAEPTAAKHQAQDDVVDTLSDGDGGDVGGAEPVVVPLPALSVQTARLEEEEDLGPGGRSPHRALAATPMGRALHELFAVDSLPSTPVTNGTPCGRRDDHARGDAEVADAGRIHDEIEETAAALAQVTALASPVSPTRIEHDNGPTKFAELETVVHSSCATADGRALFVKCLNRQRSLETRVSDQPCFDALVRCFNIFLDHCIADDDVKAAKTAMILAETFYAARPRSSSLKSTDHPRDEETSGSHGGGGGHGSPDSGPFLDSPLSEGRRRSRGSSWGSSFSHHAAGRGATRMYLQEEVKKHAIWTNPSFWEKALLLAIGEELHKTPQPCPWEDLPSGPIVARSPTRGGPGAGGSGAHVSTREEAVSRVHNIVFGQLGSFTLSMLEFEVPFAQIESFVETMCDAHELTEDQRFLLRKNLQEIFVTLKAS